MFRLGVVSDVMRCEGRLGSGLMQVRVS